MAFYRPRDRYDLWQEYVAGVTRTYQQYGAENALTLPAVTPESTTPVFAVARDTGGYVVAGWYVNGPLDAVHQAYAPSEFGADPVSAALVAEWISHVIPAGAIELKGGWVDNDSANKGALADTVGRSVLHALNLLGASFAFATAAEHATRRWTRSGGRPLPGIAPTPYPDERYLTSFFYWRTDTALELSTPEQRKLFAADTHPSTSSLTVTGAAA